MGVKKRVKTKPKLLDQYMTQNKLQRNSEEQMHKPIQTWTQRQQLEMQKITTSIQTGWSLLHQLHTLHESLKRM